MKRLATKHVLGQLNDKQILSQNTAIFHEIYEKIINDLITAYRIVFFYIFVIGLLGATRCRLVLNLNYI